MSKLVSIFVCGVQKGGTTSLYSHLCEHPALSAPSRKETHFFDDETHDWTAPDYTGLDAFFSSDDGDRLRFDVTPIYVFWPDSIAHIHAYNPDAKLIFLFRDPFERAWSQWCMEYARGTETLPFSAAILEEQARLRNLPKAALERRIYTYVERGRYAQQLKRALSYFPKDRLLFLRSEDLRSDHAKVLARIADFLGIAAFPESTPKREHSRPAGLAGLAPEPADRALISALVHDDLLEFASLSGLEISHWPSFRARA